MANSRIIMSRSIGPCVETERFEDNCFTVIGKNAGSRKKAANDWRDQAQVLVAVSTNMKCIASTIIASSDMHESDTDCTYQAFSNLYMDVNNENDAAEMFIAVSPSYRGFGIGTMLLNDTMRVARLPLNVIQDPARKYFTTLKMLRCYPKYDDIRAERMLLRAGWTKIAERVNRRQVMCSEWYWIIPDRRKNA